MPNVLSEFLSENAHRFYPLDPTFTEGAVNPTIPPALILDLGIIASPDLPDNNGANTTYLSKVVTDGVTASFYMAAKINGNTIDFGCVAVTGVGALAGTRIDLTPIRYSDGNVDIIMEGFLVVGDVTVLQQMPPTTILDANTGKIYTGCIQHLTQWVAGIKVGDQLLGGIVNISGGPGVELSVSGNDITIWCTGAIPPDNTAIVSDADIMETLKQQYGAPITSINGVAVGPDWKIAVSGDLGITTSQGGITLQSEVCCGADELGYIVDNIAALNERVGVIQSFQTQLDTNLNILSVQVAKLG